jgi:hypothetical protein
MAWVSNLQQSVARVPGVVTPGRAIRAAVVLFLAVVGSAGLVGALEAPSVPVAGKAAPVVHGLARAAEAGPAKSLSYVATNAAEEAPAASGLTAAGSTNAEFGPAQSTSASGQPARIEETGSITVVVPGDEIEADVDKLMAVATGDGGFVASTETQSATPGSPAQGTVTLQVPYASFSTALSQVRALGKVASVTTSANDVTGQYVDLQAQITAMEDSRQQYLTIMTKATTIGGILAVQSQLDNLQSQLQQLQGQLKVLNSETTYATLTATLTQKPVRVVSPPPPKPKSGLVKAWNAAVGGFVAGFEGVVRVLGPLLFALLLVAALYLLGRLSWHLYRRPARPATPEAAQGPAD